MKFYFSLLITYNRYPYKLSTHEHKLDYINHIVFTSTHTEIQSHAVLCKWKWIAASAFLTQRLSVFYLRL